MRFKTSILMMLALMCAAPSGVSQAQELVRLEEGPKAPLLRNAEAATAAKTILFANTAQIVSVSKRGSFAFSAVDETCAVFEYGNKGYEAKLKVYDDDGNFLHFKSTTHDLFVAIRKTSPFDIWFAANGTPKYTEYVDSSNVYNAP